MGTHSAGIFQYLQHCLIFWETCQECCRGDWPWMLSLIWKRHRAYFATIQHIPDSFPLPAAKLRSSKGLFLNCSLLLVAQLYPTLCKPLDCSTPGFTVLHYLPELAQSHVHWVGDAIQQSRPLSSPFPPGFNLSHLQGLFWWVGSLHQMSRVLELQFQHQSLSEYLVLISFRMDWLDLLAVQGTLKSLLQYHSSKASILWCSAFFMVQLSHPYMTTGKTIALTIPWNCSLPQFLKV